MPSVKGFITEVDKFLGEIAISHRISTREKLSIGKNLLSEAEQLYKVCAPSAKNEIAQRIATLRKRVAKLSGEVYERPVKIVSPPVSKVTPAVFEEARAFIDRISKIPPTTDYDLKRAIYTTIQLAGKIKATIARFSPHEYERWRPMVTAYQKKLSDLHRKWKSQLEEIAKREREARASSFMVEKDRYKQQKYLSSKRTGVEKGRLKSMAVESAYSLNKQILRVLDNANIIMQTATKTKNPNILPVDKLTNIIARAEMLINGLTGKVHIDLSRALKKQLRALKFKLAQMQNLKKELSYIK